MCLHSKYSNILYIRFGTYLHVGLAKSVFNDVYCDVRKNKRVQCKFSNEYYFLNCAFFYQKVMNLIFFYIPF